MKRKRFYIIITLFFLTTFIVGCASSAETVEESVSKESVPVKDLIAQADELYAQRQDLDKLREGIQRLRRGRNAEPKNFEVAWKLAKFNYYLGKNTTDEKESEKVLKSGVDAGRIAVNLEKDKPEGYFWMGANIGEQAKRSPITKGLSAVGEIKEAMNKVIELQPDYQGASAYLALGQLELATRMTGGSAEKAVELLEKGLQIEKNNSYIYLHLAEAYLAIKEQAKAKKMLEFVVNKKPDPDYLPEYQESVEKAKKMLETKF